MIKGKLYSLGEFEDPVDKIKERVYFLEGFITNLSNYYFISERLTFWSNLNVGDIISFGDTWSNKFKHCALVTYVTKGDKIENVGSRRILIHGSNEDGKVTCANSDNCLIPLCFQETLSEIMEIFRAKKFLMQGVSKAQCNSYFQQEHTLKKIQIEEIIHV